MPNSVGSARRVPGHRGSLPPSALKPNGLREVSLEITYLPIRYREDTSDIPVYLGE